MPTVLLIDDSKTIQKVAALILRGSAYRLLTAEDSESGKQLALKEKPDVALVDFTLGPKNGLDLIGELSEEPNLLGMKSALLYSHSSSVSSADLEKVKAAGKLAKPFDADEFLDLLKNLNEKPPAFQQEKKDEILGIPSSALPVIPRATRDPLENLFTEEDLEKCLNFSEKPLTAPLATVEVADKVLAEKSELIVEKVCREVIPPLAEKIIREEIQKLIKESR